MTHYHYFVDVAFYGADDRHEFEFVLLNVASGQQQPGRLPDLALKCANRTALVDTLNYYHFVGQTQTISNFITDTPSKRVYLTEIFQAVFQDKYRIWDLGDVPIPSIAQLRRRYSPHEITRKGFDQDQNLSSCLFADACYKTWFLKKTNAIPEAVRAIANVEMQVQ